MKVWVYYLNNFLTQKIFTDREKAFRYLYKQYLDDAKIFKKSYCDNEEEYTEYNKYTQKQIKKYYDEHEEDSEDGIKISFYDELPHCLKSFITTQET